jgi:hypothetical protein
MDNEKKLQNVELEIEKLEIKNAETEPRLLERIKENVGKLKKDPIIETDRRKLQRDKIRIQELYQVRDQLQKEVADRKAMEADGQLKQRAGSIVPQLVAFSNQVLIINKIREQFEKAIASLKHPLGSISDVILECHEAKKMKYIDIDSIHRNINALAITGTNPDQIIDVNTNIRTGLNRLDSAIQGKGSYHKAKRMPAQDAKSPEKINTLAQEIREQNEMDRFKHGSTF